MSTSTMRGRRLLNSRACDRCRRRKAKCDCSPTDASCSCCREAGLTCTFALPTGKRGPKVRRDSHVSRGNEDPSLFLDGSHPVQPSSSPDLPPFSPPVSADSLRGLASVALLPSTSQHQDVSVLSNDVWPPAATGPAPSASVLSSAQAQPQIALLGSVPPQTQARWLAIFQRWNALAEDMRCRLPATTLEAITNKCFDLFFEYLFPLTPIVHEPSLRCALEFFLSRGASSAAETASPSAAVHGNGLGSREVDAWLNAESGVDSLDRTEVAGDGGGRRVEEGAQVLLDMAASSPPTPLLPPKSWWPEPTFALVTAICAEAAFLLPKDIFPEGGLVADVFLRVSRDCLRSYVEADLENPYETSVAIRYFHSNCLHAAGTPLFSWHIFGEAVRLTQVMQLHDESSTEGLAPIEAELRRRAFWIVYLGDKSAALLNNRPITIHKFSFNCGITTAYPSAVGDESVPACARQDVPSPAVSDQSAMVSSPGQQLPSLIVGFNANIQLWQTSSDLLLELRLIEYRKSCAEGQRHPERPLMVMTAEEGERIDSLYVRFATCLDNLPLCLQQDALIRGGDQPRAGAATAAARQYAIQAANLHVTYHCLRMVIMQKFEDIGYLMPRIKSADMLILHKTEIARDMLRVIRGAPFWSLQVNGEPCVEKIRLVGASLLAIIHRNETSPLTLRAHNDFGELLDILARLDSKASDTLRMRN